MASGAISKPKVVFVLGGPGAGKGTQCSLLEKELNYKHISAGDCLREERKRPNSKFGELINTYIKEGKIVPVEITCNLLKNKMEALGWSGGKFLIDGFPRNADNLEGWNSVMENLVDVLFCLCIECPNEVMEKRILGRAEVSGRVDDNLESLRKRFETFKCDTLPIIEHFQAQKKCCCINGARSIEDVWKDVKQAFEEKEGGPQSDTSPSTICSPSALESQPTGTSA